jgi:hypothetical protein
MAADIDLCERNGAVGFGGVDDLQFELIGRQILERTAGTPTPRLRDFPKLAAPALPPCVQAFEGKDAKTEVDCRERSIRET